MFSDHRTASRKQKSDSIQRHAPLAVIFFLCFWRDGERGSSQTSRQQALRKHLMRILVLTVRTPSTENVETTRI